jgi:hypothetical protein
VSHGMQFLRVARMAIDHPHPFSEGTGREFGKDKVQKVEIVHSASVSGKSVKRMLGFLIVDEALNVVVGHEVWGLASASFRKRKYCW